MKIENFTENFIEIPQVVQKIWWRLSLSILTTFIDFSDFLTFPFCKESNKVSIYRIMSAFFYIKSFLSRLFNNYIMLYSYKISYLRNMKGRSNLTPAEKELPSKTSDLLGLKIWSVNVTISSGNDRFGHIYWRNP